MHSVFRISLVYANMVPKMLMVESFTNVVIVESLTCVVGVGCWGAPVQLFVISGALTGLTQLECKQHQL